MTGLHLETLYSKIEVSLLGYLLSPLLWKFYVVELFRMLGCMQESAGFNLYVLLVEEMQIQPLF